MAIKQNNFYQRWNEAAKADQTAARAATMRKLLPPLLLVLVCLIIWGILMFYTNMLKTRTDAINAWCADPAHFDPYTTSVTDQTLTQMYRSESSTAQSVWDLLGTYPDVTSSTLNRVQAAGNSAITAVFQSYSAATGQFSFNAQSSAVIDIPTYIRSLQDTGLFKSVTYTGYGYNSNGNYSINMVCILAAPDAAAAEGGQS